MSHANTTPSLKKDPAALNYWSRSSTIVYIVLGIDHRGVLDAEGWILELTFFAQDVLKKKPILDGNVVFVGPREKGSMIFEKIVSRKIYINEVKNKCYAAWWIYFWVGHAFQYAVVETERFVSNILVRTGNFIILNWDRYILPLA